MARNHATVTYVEPNEVFSGLTAAAGDGNVYDRAPDLEDYSIALDIEVELSSRNDPLNTTEKENKVIIMSYRNSKIDSRVNFMSGSKIRVDHSTPNVLTTKYADMSVTDLVDYGTTELLGIKSVDIEYNNACVPIITIKFTDVRGMSLFQPTELNHTTSFFGIGGFTQENIAQSFFHSFFAVPLPKYTVYLKGFYGQPVSYEVMCDKFDAVFNSSTGDFDVTAKFVGFAYSFMSDISFTALLAAPYSDYVGKEYWDDNVANRRFVLPDKTGEATLPMPKLYDIRKFIKTLLNESDKDMQETSLSEEESTHTLEISELSKIRRNFRKWYDELYTIASKIYGNDFVFAFGGETKDDDYRRIIILTNGKKIKGNDLSDAYKQFDDDFKRTNSDLYNLIDNFNKSSSSYRSISNVSLDFSKYSKANVFNELWYNSREKKIEFNGFSRNNILPINETMKVIFTKDDSGRRLKKMYDDGVNQYLDAFIIEQDYSDIKNRIDMLIADANRPIDEKEIASRRKKLNNDLYKKMKWYPTAENFSKIMMAHLETLMAMMYKVIDQTSGRTAQELGVSVGVDGNCTDVTTNEIPPFPRVTKSINDGSGIIKKEDVWVGDFTSGIGFREADMVDGLLNGANKIKEIEDEIKRFEKEQEREVQNTGGEEVECAVRRPTTALDFFTTKSPYGYGEHVDSDYKEFAGAIALRMYNVLALNSFSLTINEREWDSLIPSFAVTEADNFHDIYKISSIELLDGIRENGNVSTGKKILEIVTDKSKGNKYPWNTKGDENHPLLYNKGKLCLKRWETDTTYYAYGSDAEGESEHKINIYPIQGVSYENLDNTVAVFNSGHVDFENRDITVNHLHWEEYRAVKSKVIINTKNANTFNMAYLVDYDIITPILEQAASNSTDSYKEIYEKYIKQAELNSEEYKVYFPSNADFVSSFNGKIDNSHKKNGFVIISTEKLQGNIYVGDNPDNEDNTYTCDKENDLGEYFDTDIFNGVVDSGTLTEVFGFKKINVQTSDGPLEVYAIDKSHSLFLNSSYYQLDRWSLDNCAVPRHVVKMAFFVMCLDCFGNFKIDDSKTIVTMPNLLALQIGAVATARMNIPSYSGEFDMFYDYSIAWTKHYLPMSENFEKNILGYCNTLHQLAKIEFSRYFMDWANDNYSLISGKFHINFNKIDKKYRFNSVDAYNKIYRNEDDDGNILVHRALFNQDSAVVKNITTDLMRPITFVRGSKLTTVQRKNGNPIGMFELDEKKAEKYLDAFLNRLRELLPKTDEEESNNLTHLAAPPLRTTDDMRIELYRYLKQVFDKWIPSSKQEDWKYESFFNGKTEHQFHFIDSYYNKIGSKLLINPYKLSEKIRLGITYNEVNVMMFNFMVEVFKEHRCLIRCIQNFRDLSDRKAMEDMFRPVSFMEMKTPKRFSDFVVVYTYAPSRNLDVANSEFKNDGFMLNDELETPIAIRSRGNSDDSSLTETSTYYKLPAFGVSYGRQYQSIFKNIDVGMTNPIITQQAIIAKYAILNSSRNQAGKTATAQDLYDIYANQSYTCKVEMMGCAWVQPMMYFVLLNVPMFKGSYMIVKVTHRLRPGDMTTEITGCRMANISNKFIDDIFTDEVDGSEGSPNSSSTNRKYTYAEPTNDCPYKVFPIIDDVSSGAELDDITDEELTKGKGIMRQMLSIIANKLGNEWYQSNSGNAIAFAAGVVGNMLHETRGKPTFYAGSIGQDSGFLAGGLCQWRKENLVYLLRNEPNNYGWPFEKTHKGDKEIHLYKVGAGEDGYVEKELNRIGVEGQVRFLVMTLTMPAKKTNYITDKYTIQKFCSACGNNPEKAAKEFRRIYEISSQCDNARWMAANSLYNSYVGNTGDKKVGEKQQDNTKNFTELFFKAVQKSANSSSRTAVKLTPTYNDDNILEIRQETSGENKLGYIFDIILNGYYKHIKALGWIYDNTYRTSPIALVVDVTENTNITKREIFVEEIKKLKSADRRPFSESDKEPGQINEQLIRSIAKRYMPDPSTSRELFTECPQFRDIRNIFKDYTPKSCNEVYAPNTNTTGTRGGGGSTAQIPTSAKITILDWDVEKAVKWIIENRLPQWGKGRCAEYVEKAISAGFGDPIKYKMLTTENGAGNLRASNLRWYNILESKKPYHQFDEMYADYVKPGGNTSFPLQAGDVAVIGKINTGRYHACMWTGNKWYSDHEQTNMVSSKYEATSYPYAIYRYHGKDSDAKAVPKT